MFAHTSRMPARAAGALLLLLAGVEGVHAQPPAPGPRERLDLQLMEQRLRGLSYHQEQQRLRDADRRSSSAPVGRIEVPLMRPGCPPGAGGSRLSTGC